VCYTFSRHVVVVVVRRYCNGNSDVLRVRADRRGRADRCGMEQTYSSVRLATHELRAKIVRRSLQRRSVARWVGRRRCTSLYSVRLSRR